MTGFWIAAALLTAAVVALLGRPLMRKAAPATDGGNDLAVYRDQLAELERDRTRGLIEPGQAASLETEIGRRMLVASRTAQPAATTMAPSRLLTFALATFFPIAGLAIYLMVGQPDLPGLPLAAREISAGADPVKVLAAIEQIKKKLHPDEEDDLDRWVMVAEAYSKIGHAREAVEAFRVASNLAPEDPSLGTALAEALISADGGAVGEEAKSILATIPPNSDAAPETRYYLALGAAQAGDMKTALKDWQSLLADSPADASWVDSTRARIAGAAQALSLDPEKEMPEPLPPKAASSGALPAPTGPDAEAIQKMPPAEQTQMIQGMVAKLAAKLEANPDDATGWRQLARAYQVMGEKDKAKDALDHAAIADAKAAAAKPATGTPAIPSGAPDSAQGKAIQQLTPDQQVEMIQGMVAKLAAKLEASPDDPTGWRQLARAYQMMGDNDKAKNALDRAAAADAKAAKP